jgi:hypothetical protein
VFDDFASFDEGNIPEAELLCLPLFCFWYFAILAQPHCPEVDGYGKLSHCSS